jgi:hypothetical protein
MQSTDTLLSKLPPDFPAHVTLRPETGCVLWAGVRGKHAPHRYGRKLYEGKLWPTHALSWVLANGRPVPDGKVICHTCDTPACVNPDHLWDGTDADNAKDKAKKGRSTRGATHGLFTRGERNGLAKLSETDIPRIRQSIQGPTALARLYGVSPATICAVRKGRIWSHVP